MGDLSSWVGIILQTVAILGTVGAFLVRLQLDLKLLIQSLQQSKIEISDMKDQMKVLSHVVVDIAKQDARLNNLEARIQEISNRIFEMAKAPTS
jgi:Tfp pilus assembly protein PilN